eukprot:gene21067-25887_t
MATGTAATGAGQQQPALALLSTPGNNDNGDFSRHNSNLSAIHSDVAMITSPTKMTPTLTTGGASCSSATATAATTTTGAHHHLFHQHKRQSPHSPQQQATLAWMDIAKRYADTYYNFAIALIHEFQELINQQRERQHNCPTNIATRGIDDLTHQVRH